MLWGDVCGYVWGRTSQRVTVPITNEKQKQTYYGAIELQTHELLIQPYLKGESQFTVAFLKYLQAQYPESRIALIWDGASYHRSGEVKNYLDSVNQGFEPHEWKITCIRFAPNAPEQNPIERGFSSGLITRTEENARGQGAYISVDTNPLQISDGAVLSARSTIEFSGGNIVVNLPS